MIQTAPNSLNLTALSATLTAQVLKQTTAEHFQQIHCGWEEGKIVARVEMAKLSQPDIVQVLNCLRSYLTQLESTLHYPIKIFLSVPDLSETATLNARRFQPKSEVVATDIDPRPNQLFLRQWQWLTSLPYWRWWGGGIVLGLSLFLIGGIARWQHRSISLNEQSSEQKPFQNPTSEQTATVIPSLEKLTTLDQLQVKDAGTSSQPLEDDIQFIQQANKLVAQASELAKSTDRGETHWLQRQSLLQQALLPLARISPNSLLYSLAQSKQQTYTEQLAVIAATLEQEKQAQAQLNQAIAMITQGKQSSLVARDVAAREKALNQWQQGLAKLRQIPQESTVSATAKRWLTRYQIEYRQLHQRQVENLDAENAYQSALEAAKNAEAQIKSGQWHQSVKSWQQAIAYLNQVPQGSGWYLRSQLLLPGYQTALREGQNYLARLAQQQQVSIGLQKICQSVDNPCHFQMGIDEITVQLKQDYLQELWETSLQAKAAGSIQEQATLMNYLVRLEDHFQQASNQSGLPLVVYHADGRAVAEYSPQ